MSVGDVFSQVRSSAGMSDVPIISPVLDFLTTNHLALLITHLAAHLQFAEAQPATSKA